VHAGGSRLAKSSDRHEGREVKLSYVHGVGTTPLIAHTIGGALNGAAERWGDRDALVARHQQLRFSYRELRDEADRAARALIALGVQRGDRVGIWSGNRAEWMIIRGGENIYPREIEEFLHTHEKISDVQVIGVPDHKYGEEVCAWIRLRDGVTATAEELREFCRGQIATYKIPRYVRFTSEFPMTVTGKVQKFKMREITVAELALARVTEVEPT
jgi:acyl-CoA synthetase (AMP-forming)/AMP-acid ligase II